MIMEAPAFLVIGIMVLFSGHAVSTLSILLLCLWEVHYCYRTLLFPMLIKDNGKRFPLMLVAFAFIFNTLNGYANGLSLANSAPPNGGLFSTVRICLGVAMFVGGFFTHVWADHDLRNLRKPGEVGYKLPHGGLFEYVSNPNYFGEIVEWGGFALAAWYLPGLAFVVFTIANLVPRAHANRAWYQQTFPDYPKERKRVIPFLF
jgi:3-oxo-5-alpha-steroid 4-dehydrogenase 1